MFDLSNIVDSAITMFLQNIFDQLITIFATTLAKIMGTALDVLKEPLVVNGIKYSQILAFALLVVKSMNEAFQTYILYQNGDPEADPTGLLVRTCQAVAIISTLPWIVEHVFAFGSSIATDVASLSTGQAGIKDWVYLTEMMIANPGAVIATILIFIVLALLVVGIQATIRGAELALMSVLGPIMALNLTANNRNIWSAWFKQLIIICTTQALQIFMIQGALSMLTSRSITSGGLIMIFGWLWVTIKTPKYLQSFLYSTGFTGAVGGTAKQVGLMALTRRMITK